MGADSVKQETCKLGSEAASNYRTRLPGVAEAIIASCTELECHTHIDYEPIPSRQVVVDIIARMRELLFPGYFSRGKIDPVTLRYSLGQVTSETFDLLSKQICRSNRHDCFRYDQPCTDCENRGQELALQLLDSIPAPRRTLAPSASAIPDHPWTLSAMDK